MDRLTPSCLQALVRLSVTAVVILFVIILVGAHPGHAALASPPPVGSGHFRLTVDPHQSSLQNTRASASLSDQVIYTGADGNLFLLRGDLNTPIPLTNDAADHIRYSHPSISPDGRLLAYLRITQFETMKTDLYLADTIELQPFLLQPDIGFSYTWASDGQSIVFSRFVFGMFDHEPDRSAWNLYRIDLSTRQVTEVMPSTGGALTDPQVSPNGRWLSAFDFCFECIGQFYTLDLTTGARYQWSEKDTDRFVGLGVDWAPDSQRLVFDQAIIPYTAPGQTAALFTAAPDGSDRRLLFEFTGRTAASPKWSPDGQWIAFMLMEVWVEENAYQRRSELWLVQPDGSGARSIFSAQGISSPLAWSPDGRSLLFSVEDWQNNRSFLYLFDAQLGSTVLIPGTAEFLGGVWNIDWGRLPSPIPPGDPLTAPLVTQDTLGLVYLSANQALTFYDPLTGAYYPLSAPNAASSFAVSPSGRNILLGGRLLMLSFNPNGALVALERPLLNSSPSSSADQTTPLPTRQGRWYSGYNVTWSPDEDQFAYQDAQERVWIDSLAGPAQLLPGARWPPVWSPDGRWLAYCEGDVLWLMDTAGTRTELARSADCFPSWSSSQNLLAYSLGSYDFESDTRQAMVYDPDTGAHTLLLNGGGVHSWSPDGRLLAISRIDAMGASAYGYTIFIAEPRSARVLELGGFYSRGAGSQDWLPLQGGYVFGRYQVAPDLSAAWLLADPLFDISLDGQRLLVGNGEYNPIDISCFDRPNSRYALIQSISLDAVYGAVMPGVWGWLSPDGQWALVSSFRESPDPAAEQFQTWLARCDGSRLVELPGLSVPPWEQGDPRGSRDPFSDDNHWLALRLGDLTASGSSQLYIYNLQTGSANLLPIANRSPIAWVRTPLYTPPTYAASGRVMLEDSQPVGGVTILANGLLGAVTNPDGTFSLPALYAGTYILTLQSVPSVAGLEGTVTPPQITISVPPEVHGLQFTVSQAVPTTLPLPTQTGAATTPGKALPPADRSSTPPAESTPGRGGIPAINTWIPGNTQILLLGLCGSALLAIGVSLGWMFYRRSR